MGVNGIYGLSGSGLDIESMVKVGMMGKQSQLDKMQQKTDLATWKKEAMSSVYSDLSTMNYSTLTQYKLQSNMNAMSATSSDESVVKVTANGSAASMTHKVSVGGLSSNAYLITADKITRANTSASSSIYLGDNLFSNGDPKSGDTKVYSIDGNNYVGEPTKGASATYYTFYPTYGGSTLSVKQTGEGDNKKYFIKDDSGEYVNELTGSNKTAAELLISRNGEQLIAWSPNPQTFINGVYYGYNGSDGRPGLQITDSTTDYTFFSDPSDPSDLGKTYTFSNKTDGTGFSGYSYKDGNETVTKTQDISADFNELVDDTKFISNGKIVSNDDIAVSFTLLDGTEDFNGMSPEEIAEEKKKYTVSYTYGQLASGGKTYNDLAADINALGTNVKASYDATNDSFSLTNKNSGKDNVISLTMNTDLAATLFNNLGLKQSKDGVLSPMSSAFAKGDTNTTAGSSGSITIDGKTYNNVEDNRITVDGVTYNLQNVSSSAESSDKYTVVGSDGTTVIGTVKEAASAKTVNVVINQDTDAIIEKVKSFVEDYNKMLDSLYEKYSETKYSDYKPLTDSQRDKMTEKQIEKWEEKAKSGLLYHDRTIGNIIDKMREAVSTPIEGLDSKYNSAYSIGIYTSKTNGHIALDEDRLKKALAEDPEAAYKIFGTLPESDSKGNYDYDKMGVAQRLGDVMVQAMKNVKTEAGESADISDGSNLGNKIMEFQQKMSDFKTLMSAFESRLFKKYDAMESLLATLGAQMNYITGGQ